MKSIKMFWYLFLLPFSVYSQDTIGDSYVYTRIWYWEKLDLYKDGTFLYQNKQELIRDEIKGNWQLRNDSILVLDSQPQRSEIIVFESSERGKKKVFRVRNIEGYTLSYHLYLITNEQDTVAFRGQYKETITTGNYSSFYIVFTSGLHSPVYTIKNEQANFFDIILGGRRIFDNEHWKYHGEYIIPLGIDKKYSKYKLTKDKKIIKGEEKVDEAF